MDLLFGQLVTRERRRRVVDPYDPENETLGSWEDPLDTLPLPGAFVASSSSSSVSTATRTQAITTKSLYLTDVAADVQLGDRVRWGSSVLYIEAMPAADTSPFTGWQPLQEIPLTETRG